MQPLSASPAEPKGSRIWWDTFPKVCDVESLSRWWKSVEAGRVKFRGPSPSDQRNWSNAEDVVFNHAIAIAYHSPDRFAEAKPVLDGLVERGFSPFKGMFKESRSIYAMRCQGGTVDSPLLRWCVGLDHAPSHLEKDLARRVRSDILESLLEKSSFGSSHQIEQIASCGLSWNDTWADGQTTVTRAARAQGALVEAGASPYPEPTWEQAQARLEELSVLVGLLRQQGAPESDFHAVWLHAALQWVRPHAIASLYEKKHLIQNASWVDRCAAMTALETILMEARGRSPHPGQTLELHKAAMAWALRQPPSLALATAVLAGGMRVALPAMTDDPLELQQALEAVLDSAHAATALLEVNDATPFGVYSRLIEFPWACGLKWACELLSLMPEEAIYRRHPGWWGLALPTVTGVKNSEPVLENAFRNGNLWPATDLMMALAEQRFKGGRGWHEEAVTAVQIQRAQRKERRLRVAVAEASIKDRQPLRM